MADRQRGAANPRRSVAASIRAVCTKWSGELWLILVRGAARGRAWLHGAVVPWLRAPWGQLASHLSPRVHTLRANVRRWSAWLGAHGGPLRRRLSQVARAHQLTPRLRIALARWRQQEEILAGDEIDIEVAALESAPRWERLFAPSGRRWRALIVISALSVALCVVTSGSGLLLTSASDAWAQVRAALAPQPPVNALPVHLRASSWLALHLPPDGVLLRSLTLAPSPASAEVAYLCWPNHRRSESDPSALVLYATRDAARSWIALSSPVTDATDCQFVPDALDSARVLLLPSIPAAETCAAPQVYASDAWGASWRRVALPAPLRTACSLALFSLGGQLFAWSTDGRYESDGVAGSPLLTSRDGVTWSSALPPLGQPVLPQIVGAHADGSLLVVTHPAPTGTAGTSSRLWCRDGATGNWSSLGNLPAGTGQVAVSTDVRAGTGCRWQPIYAYAAAVNPDTSATVVTALHVRVGSAWQSLPAAPVSGATQRWPLGASGAMLTVGPGGTLLGDVLVSGIGGSGGLARSIWAWYPGLGRWLRDYQQEPGNAVIDGYSWDHTQRQGAPMVIWLYSVNAGLFGFTGVFRSTLAAAPVAPAGTSDLDAAAPAPAPIWMAA
jgi:hypothetical protein